MKFKSPVYSQVSGSIAGLTYSHNSSGLYSRARAIPVNPQTAPQTAVRNLLNTQVNRWSNILTDAQRQAWNVFGANVPTINLLGDATLKSGINWYVGMNVLRRQSGLAQVDTAPTTFTLADLTTPTVVTNAGADTTTLGFTNTDEWANEVGGALILFASRPQSQGINFFKGPYRLSGKVSGGVIPPATPATINLPFPVAAGNKVFYRLVAVRADGRPSPITRIAAIAV